MLDVCHNGDEHARFEAGGALMKIRRWLYLISESHVKVTIECPSHQKLNVRKRSACVMLTPYLEFTRPQWPQNRKIVSSITQIFQLPDNVREHHAVP